MAFGYFGRNRENKRIEKCDVLTRKLKINKICLIVFLEKKLGRKLRKTTKHSLLLNIC